jgi:hypothetical protein
MLKRKETNFSFVLLQVEGDIESPAVTYTQVATIDQSDGLIPGTDFSPLKLQWHPKGLLLASVSSGPFIQLWRVQENIVNQNDPRSADTMSYNVSLFATLNGHQISVSSISWQQDGMLASAGSDTTVVFWDVADHDHPISRCQPSFGSNSTSTGNTGKASTITGAVCVTMLVLIIIAIAMCRRRMARQRAAVVGNLQETTLGGNAATRKADLVEAAALLARLRTVGNSTGR